MTRRRSSRVVALIPARAGSVGVKSKNTRLVADLPLYEHALRAALAASLDEIHISTDIASILEHRFEPPVRAWRREPALAGSEASMADVVRRHIEEAGLGDEMMILLQPTSPLRTAAHIIAALDAFEASDCSMLMSVVEVDAKVLKYGYLEDGMFRPFENARFLYANRQSLPRAARPNGAIYIFRAADFIAAGGFPSERIAAFSMSDAESLDIDTEGDLIACEQAMATMLGAQ